MHVRDRRVFLPLLALLILLAPLQCRRADGTEEDPMDREAQADFVQYLKIDTSNPPGNETAGAKYLQQLFAKDGIEARLVGSDPRRQSVYARLRSGKSGKALLLLHHIDVVPVVTAEWTKPAFAGLVSDGYIWGRGALDVKSLGIANLMAMLELKRSHVPLQRDVIFLGVADEERGGQHGCRELLEQHPELFADVGYVLNEGGDNETIVDKVALWGIEVQQKVPLWVRLHAKGAAGHSAAPPDDGGAIVKLVHAVDAVSRIPTPYRLLPSVERAFHESGKARRDEKGALLRSISAPLDVPRLEHVLSPGYRALLHDTIAITRIEGGTSSNVMTANASADVDVRLLPDEKSEPMLAQIRSAVGTNADVDVLLSCDPVVDSPIDTDLYRVLTKSMREAEPDSVVAPIVGAGTSDSRFFRARGIVAYGIAPFKVNYYDAGTVHGNDERIRARFFIEGVRLVRGFVRQFCAAPQ